MKGVGKVSTRYSSSSCVKDGVQRVVVECTQVLRISVKGYPVYEL